MKRRPEFIDWLKMLRQNGKFLYVITGVESFGWKVLVMKIGLGWNRLLMALLLGSHVDFASHVASYALGEDW